MVMNMIIGTNLQRTERHGKGMTRVCETNNCRQHMERLARGTKKEGRAKGGEGVRGPYFMRSAKLPQMRDAVMMAKVSW